MTLEEHFKSFLSQVDSFMEIFPSMSYEQVMAMPFKDFKTLHNLRVKRKVQEQKDLDAERKKIEEENRRNMNRQPRKRWGK